MAGARKALFRFVLLILFIPVGLLLVLHFFGENRMEVPNFGYLEDCILPNSIVVLQSGNPETNIQKNQLLRINKNLATKGLKLNDQEQNCLGDTLAILLVDKKHQLRGTYLLEQSEINRFFAELDILLMNESYGEGVSR